MSATMAIECRSFPCWKQDSVSSMPATSPHLVPLTASSQRSHLGHRLHDLSTKRPMRPRSIRLPKATPPTPLNPADPNRSYWRNQQKTPADGPGRYNDDSCSYERRVDFIAFPASASSHLRPGWRATPSFDLAARPGVFPSSVVANITRTAVEQFFDRCADALLAWDAKANRDRPGDAEVEQAASLYGPGWSLAELGTMVGVDPATDWRRLGAVDVKCGRHGARQPHMS